MSEIKIWLKRNAGTHSKSGYKATLVIETENCGTGCLGTVDEEPMTSCRETCPWFKVCNIISQCKTKEPAVEIGPKTRMDLIVEEMEPNESPQELTEDTVTPKETDSPQEKCPMCDGHKFLYFIDDRNHGMICPDCQGTGVQE